ncbi:pyridoxamine 5'-phosphate oxidase family protein [Thalassotalea marina]|uniref:Flavin-nucleotide-binding protein n=1 Tax=Thalassotalea marina TaxID=1673741 RepID=A0A919BL59_9GAMM|nr:pyridoxamine 5'-phosphate oxidase family protein [Thalassotalea marina]GHF94691.1 flavin-nucleotide-binding protein [Thalassotalea marina]
MTTEHATDKTQIKRGRKRASYDIELAKAIIDDSLLCHIGQHLNGQTIVTPTCHWRDGDRLYWHGHIKARNVVGSDEQEVCINISQLDGLVLARSAFHHSVNYRSVTLFGKVQLVTDPEEKLIQLKKFIDKVSPHRWETLRPIHDKELMITSVAWIAIDEFSVKMRNAGVNDDEEDLNWPVWAGVMPIESQFLAPVVEKDCTNQTIPPTRPQALIGGKYKKES